MTNRPNIDVYMVDTEEAFANLCSYVREGNFQYISLDVETDSRSDKTAKLFGIGLCFQDNEAFYIPIRKNTRESFWSKFSENQIYSQIYAWCQEHKLIGWNLVYDTLVFENNTSYCISDFIYSDGILLKHTVDEERPFGLKETAVKYLGEWADKAQEALKENIRSNGGKTTKEEMEMWKADTDVLGEYCGWDVILTYKLFEIFEQKLAEEGLTELFYEKEVMPLYREVTVPMKRAGFTVDVPYFEKLKRDITIEIDKLEDAIQAEIESEVSPFVYNLLNEDFPYKRTGNFPKMYADLLGTPLPTNASGAITMAKTFVQKAAAQADPNDPFYTWMLGQRELKDAEIDAVQRHWFKQSEDRRYIFNLKSNDHLGWLLFTRLGEKPISFTEETKKPKCDDDYLESIKDKYSFVSKLVDLKKLLKLSSTYIDGILERQIDGVVYTSMLQFGTTSGRYSSRDPNLQNIPRVKDDEANLSELVLRYTNAIKRGFVAPNGYKILNADYSSLEPVCFAHVSGDERLREVFRKGYDLYSQIAIDVFGVTGCSANKKDKNYLKNKHPELRQKAKVFCLAVVYGAEAGRISQSMGVDYKEAERIIESYLDAYPELRKYMQRCDYLAKKHGIAKTDFGRIRHLPVAKDLYSRWGEKILDKNFAKRNDLEDIRYKLKNALNNSKNFPIQGLASHIVNRAMIATARSFKAAGIDGWICMQVHDEITCVVREEQIDEAKSILRECMEKTTVISVPLAAEPLVASNWAEAK